MIKEFYQRVTNENGDAIDVIDFAALRSKHAHINIIMSERETQGKTTSAMEHLLDRYLEHGERGMLLLNKVKYFDENLGKLIAANKAIYPDRWRGVRISKKGLFHGANQFVYFVSLLNFDDFKIGTRDVRITTIIYDEFNMGLRLIKNKQPDYFENIIRSCRDNVRVFILGNKVTMNVPLLARLRITDPHLELQTGNLEAMRILCYIPKKNKNLDAFIKRKPDWRNSLSKALMLYRMNVLNEETYDNIEHVVPPRDHHLFKQRHGGQYIFFDFKEYAKVWQRADGVWFLEYTNDLPAENVGQIYCLKAKKSDIGILYDIDYRWQWIQDLEDDRIYFSDQSIKMLFLGDLF